MQLESEMKLPSNSAKVNLLPFVILKVKGQLAILIYCFNNKYQRSQKEFNNLF